MCLAIMCCHATEYGHQYLKWYSKATVHVATVDLYDAESPAPIQATNKMYHPGGVMGDCNNTKLPSYFPLSASTLEEVEKFVFFIGYPRSGHSMIGSVLDAHPDMVVAHEYFLFEKCTKMLKKGKHIFRDKPALFNALFANSYISSKCGWRSDSKTKKGYNFNFDFEWQGRFDTLRVIGDKSGGSAAKFIGTRLGSQCLGDLSLLKVPVVAVHVVRNPYDMIATATLVSSAKVYDKTSQNVSVHEVKQTALYNRARMIFNFASIVSQLIAKAPNLGISVLEIHIEDYIRDPPNVVRSICTAFDVDCPQDYVDKCTNRTFRDVSRSRDLVQWPSLVLKYVKRNINSFSFFEGYTFQRDFRNV